MMWIEKPKWQRARLVKGAKEGRELWVESATVKQGTLGRRWVRTNITPIRLTGFSGWWSLDYLELLPEFTLVVMMEDWTDRGM